MMLTSGFIYNIYVRIYISKFDRITAYIKQKNIPKIISVLVSKITSEFIISIYLYL